jgi:hypothetical protein
MSNYTKDHQRDPLWLRNQWEDLTFGDIFQFGPAALNPTLRQWPANGGVAWEFNNGHELLFAREMPHDWKLTTNLRLHVHWTPHARGVLENGKTVNWRIDLSVTAGNGVVAAVTTYDLTATCPNQDNGHLIQGATAEVDMSGISTLSPWLSGRVYRLAGDTWATNTLTNRPYLLQASAHYIKDRPGSRQELVK